MSPVVTALREQPRGRVEVQLDGAAVAARADRRRRAHRARRRPPARPRDGPDARPRASPGRRAGPGCAGASAPRPLAAGARAPADDGRRPGSRARGRPRRRSSASGSSTMPGSPRRGRWPSPGAASATRRSATTSSARESAAGLVEQALAGARAGAEPRQGARRAARRRPEDRPLARGQGIRGVEHRGRLRRSRGARRICRRRLIALGLPYTLHPTFCLHTAFFRNRCLSESQPTMRAHDTGRPRGRPTAR